MTLFTTDALSFAEIEEGELLWACAITAANILRDFREHITNTFGGQMKRYEGVVAETLERALADLDAKATAKGYDGVVAVRISNPKIVEGGVEVIVYGTGFRYRNRPATAPMPR